MVAFAVLFFLLLVSVLTAVAIMTALKTVDFFDAADAYFRRAERIENRLGEIARLLESRGGGKE